MERTQFNSPKILGVIPARGGSKGFPGKNIYPVNGTPLIAFSIEASLRSSLICKTIVSSDDDEILKVSKSYGAETLKRPYKYATDTANSESVILDALHQLQKVGETFDIVVLLQPTSPLRTAQDIDSSIHMMIEKKANAVISVTNIGIKPFKAFFVNKKGYVEGVYNNETPNMRRQDLPDAFLANGAIYGVSVRSFLSSQSFIPEKTISYIMDKNVSIDIDTIEDIKTLESILNKRF